MIVHSLYFALFALPYLKYIIIQTETPFSIQFLITILSSFVLKRRQQNVMNTFFMFTIKHFLMLLGYNLNCLLNESEKKL